MTEAPSDRYLQFSSAFKTPHARQAVAGGTLAYWRFGAGPDVVALHGWPLHSATYRRLLPYLAPHFTVHLFDLPGTGQTKWHGAIGLPENAAAVSEAIAALGLRQYSLLAHDSGGVVARLIAQDNPCVQSLVLCGSEIPGHHPALLSAYLWSVRVPGLPRILTALLQQSAFRRSMLAFGTCFSDSAYADGDFADFFVRPLGDAEVAQGQFALLRSFRFDLIDRLVEVHARIRAPTLCIWGERDPFFPIRKARRMLDQFAGKAALVEIPRARLFPHEDHAYEFAAHAVPFLKQELRQ